MSRRSSGHALVMAIVILVLVASTVALLAAQFGLQARLVSQEARRIHLVALSDAALAETLAELSRGTGHGGVPEHRLGDGFIASEVRRLPNERVRITTVSRYLGWRRKTRALVRLTPNGPVILSWDLLSSGPELDRGSPAL